MVNIISDNEVIVSTENNEYCIHATKKPRVFGYSNYGKYIITLSFRNAMNQEIFKINTNEREFLLTLEYISEFSANIGCIISDIIHFESSGDMRNYYWYVYYRYETIDQVIDEFDDNQEIYIGISIYEEYKGQKAVRGNFEMTYEYLVDFFIPGLFQLIQDINYLDRISISELVLTP